MLTFFIIISTGAGFLMSLRFKVLVLVPAGLLITVGATLASVANSQGYWTNALTIIAVILFQQCGYIIGCITQVFIPARPLIRTTIYFRHPGQVAGYMKYLRRY
jgi:hypothetical protein